MSYLVHENQFHVIIERNDRQMTACGGELPEEPTIVPQPPVDERLCKDCFYACSPTRRATELRTYTLQRNRLDVAYKPKNIKPPRRVKPLTGQLGLPLAEGEGKIFDGHKWVKKED